MKTQGLTKLLSLEEWQALGNWLDGMWVMDCGGGGGGWCCSRRGYITLKLGSTSSGEGENCF